MSFENPWALLILLAIPVLIIIYLLRNKYKEETAPSTYLWEVAQQFLKKRNPLRSIEHLIALIVQILTVAGMAIALAHPVLTVKGKADNIVFVLDASASMNMVEDGVTRFDKAKDEIYQVASDAYNGSKFSLIYSGKETEVVCESIDDLSNFKLFLDSLSCSTSYSELSDSMSAAQEIISKGDANVCYLATDKNFEKGNADNVEIIDVSTDLDNYAIDNLTFSYDGTDLNITGDIISYKSDASIEVYFYINELETALGRVVYNVSANTTYSMNLTQKDMDKYLEENNMETVTSLKGVIQNKDCLEIDNTYIAYDNSSVTNTSILLVSDSPLFLSSLFTAFGCSVKTLSTSSYKATTGYDITVFDSYAPSALPTTGAVWFFGCTDTVENAGFNFQGNRENSDDEPLAFTNDTDSLLYNEFVKNTSPSEIIVNKYARYTLSADFTTVMTLKNLPMIFAGKNSNGQREVVFGFDLHESDISLGYNLFALTRNFLNYSNPTVLDKFVYEVDSDVVLSIPDDVSKVEITTPSKNVKPVNIDDKEMVTYTLSEVGNYTISVYYEDNTYTNINVYSSYRKEEGSPVYTSTENVSLVINDTNKGNGIWDNLLPVVIAVAVLFATDWILYAHEQY